MNDYVQLWSDLFPAFLQIEWYHPKIRPMSGNCIRGNIVIWYGSQVPAEA